MISLYCIHTLLLGADLEKSRQGNRQTQLNLNDENSMNKFPLIIDFWKFIWDNVIKLNNVRFVKNVGPG